MNKKKKAPSQKKVVKREKKTLKQVLAAEPEQKQLAVLETSDIAIDSSMMVNPEKMISLAINKGVSVETMERILAMRRELKEEWAREEFFKALSMFQKRCPPIVKSRIVKSKDGKERYRFAPLDDIIAQTKNLLEECGFSYMIMAEQTDKSVKAICLAKHVCGHGETTGFEVPIDPDAFMNAAQKVASALTYAKRYAFCNAFGIMTTDDDDDSRATDYERSAGADRPKPVTPVEKPRTVTPEQAKVLDAVTTAPSAEAAARVQKVVDSFDWKGKTVEYQWVSQRIKKGVTDELADNLITHITDLKLPPKVKPLDKAAEEGIF